MVPREPPHHAEADIDQAIDTLTFPSYISGEAKDFLRRLLVLDPTERLGSIDDSNEIRRVRNL